MNNWIELPTKHCRRKQDDVSVDHLGRSKRGLSTHGKDRSTAEKGRSTQEALASAIPARKNKTTVHPESRIRKKKTTSIVPNKRCGADRTECKKAGAWSACRRSASDRPETEETAKTCTAPAKHNHAIRAFPPPLSSQPCIRGAKSSSAGVSLAVRQAFRPPTKEGELRTRRSAAQ
jgi:hypothetical protein